MDNTPPHNSLRILLLAVALIVAATVLGIVSSGANTLSLDVRFSLWIQQWQGDLPAVLYHIGDMLGDTVAAIAVMLAGIVIALILKHRSIAIFMIVVGVLRLIGMGLKPIFDSPRPVAGEVQLFDIYDGTGYPSGHSMTAAMIATVAVVLAWHLSRNPRVRWAVLLAAVAVTVVVGWSRIWGGAHWPSDVVGGWSFGIALVLIVWSITKSRAGSHIEPRRTGSSGWR